MNNLFHLAFPVHDLSAAREFYGTVLGCEEGRSSERWIDFNLYGHQIVAHLLTTPSCPSKVRAASAARDVDQIGRFRLEFQAFRRFRRV